MERWIRRIRGAIGMGLTWAAAWFGAGMVLLLIVGPDAADVPFPLGFGLLGFLAGVTFSGILGLVEGRRSFHEMSLPRFALWGGLGGFVFSAIFVTATGLGPWAYLVLGGSSPPQARCAPPDPWPWRDGRTTRARWRTRGRETTVP